MVINNDVYHLPEVVLRLSKSIRHCAVIDKYGNVVAGMTRKNLQPLMTDENSQRQALQAAIRHFSKPEWARNLGQMYYGVSRYEKVIGATMPITNSYMMLVAFDHDTEDFDKIIMRKILPIVKSAFERNL